jgi:hypothetical protein
VAVLRPFGARDSTVPFFKGELMSKSSLIKKADMLFATWFHNHYHECCICGDPEFELMHLIPRTEHLTRWEKLNALPGCAYHHKYSKLLSCHGSPEAFEDWIADNYPEHHYYFITNRHIIGVSLTEDWYRAKVEELKLW